MPGLFLRSSVPSGGYGVLPYPHNGVRMDGDALEMFYNKLLGYFMHGGSLAHGRRRRRRWSSQKANRGLE